MSFKEDLKAKILLDELLYIVIFVQCFEIYDTLSTSSILIPMRHIYSQLSANEITQYRIYIIPIIPAQSGSLYSHLIPWT